MARAWVILFAAVAVLGGCRAAATVRVDGCARDEDCSSTTIGDNCCDRCEPVAGTQETIRARIASCQGRAGGPPSCPDLDCPKMSDVPKCVAGQCTLARSEPQ